MSKRIKFTTEIEVEFSVDATVNPAEKDVGINAPYIDDIEIVLFGSYVTNKFPAKLLEQIEDEVFLRMSEEEADKNE